MFAKSFITLDGNGRLTSARTTQIIPYGRYTCHQCNSTKKYHPEYEELGKIIKGQTLRQIYDRYFQ